MRTLIRSGVDPSVANLFTQPAERNVSALEHAQNAHIQASRQKAR